MHTIDIPKHNGKVRRIYVPSRKEMAASRSALADIEGLVVKACPENVVHGFVRGRSPVTNAMSHVGHQYTITMDLRTFFDTVTERNLSGKVPQSLLPILLYDGAARQGLPASPACANLAAAPMDHAIIKMLSKRKSQVVYTRYADDMAFSFDDKDIVEWLTAEVSQIASRCGFQVAKEKTRLQDSRAGRRIICGVAVDDNGIHPTREAKRRLRSATHNAKTDKAFISRSVGLAEWCKLKPPKTKKTFKTTDKDTSRQIQQLAKAWRLGNVKQDKIPDKGPDVDLGDGHVITGDPVYILGMSTYTTGWTSCMSNPTGAHRRGTVFWAHLRGTRIAATLSSKTKSFGGVERRLMRCRCLIHTLRNGTLVFDRMYGDAESCEKLRKRLVDHGVMSVFEAKIKFGKEKVIGHAPARWKAWFDTLNTSTSKSSSGQWAGCKVRVCFL